MNPAADHLTLTGAAIAALPPGHRRRLMITCDGAGASHALVAHLDKLAARRGYELTYSVGWALGEREKTALRMVPEQAWQIAIDSRGEVRERRADDACANAGCAHRACRIDEAHISELTGLLRSGPGGDQLRAGQGPAMRVFAPRAAASGRAADLVRGRGRLAVFPVRATNRPADTKGWLGQNAYIDAAHRVQARVEDAIRTGKDCGIGHFPSFDFGINAAWLTASMPGQYLLAWLKLLALDGDLAEAKPRRCATGSLVPAILVRSGRKRRLKIQATWPWADAITAAWQRIDALPQAP